MGRRLAGAGAITTLLLLSLVAGCGPRPTSTSPSPSPTVPEPTASNLTENDESGPESPIAYGFRVPQGASQVGPLIRHRSARLQSAYQPELDAAQARRDADEVRRCDEAELRGTPCQASNPEPTSAPTNDTFRLLSNPPKPDVTVSVMRVNGSPTAVVRAMLAQIDVILPKAGIVRSDLGKYCSSENKRVTGCYVSVEGVTRNKRKLAVTLQVDPGDIITRTSAPATNQRPVMVLRVAYVGDPRAGQADRRFDSDIEVPAGVLTRDRSGLIWPGMDLDARSTSRLLNGWRAPKRAKILISSYQPDVVVASTTRALDASRIAERWAAAIQAEPEVDVVEDLNEITTTYTAVGPNGEQGSASYVLSARGYYAVLFWTPAPSPDPSAPVAPAATVTY